MKKEDTVSLLTKEEVDEAVRLSSQVDWNQTESDWVRLIELNPESCFLYRENNQIVGTATLATYGSHLGWIGMVIVDKSHRGMGIGRHLLEAVIEAGREQRCDIIGLDATDQGRRLYKQYGFCDVQPIDRWSGILLYKKADSCLVESLKGYHLSEALQLDFQWTGYDRSKLIRHLFNDEAVRGLGLIRKGQLKGIAFIREGQQYFHLGPILANTLKDYADLLNKAARILQNRPVLVDSIRREETTALLRERGLKVQRRLTRMTLDKPRQVLDNPKLRTAVSFEWG